MFAQQVKVLSFLKHRVSVLYEGQTGTHLCPEVFQGVDLLHQLTLD